MKVTRKGFTLVELLIVIVVIGILSAMMMLSSTEAVSSAKANNIISNLRNMKTATLAWYTDNLDSVVRDANGVYTITIDGQTGKTMSDLVKDHSDEILKYLNNDKSITLQSRTALTAGNYSVVAMVNSSKWYVCYFVNSSETRVKEKLAARAKSIGLLGSTKDALGADGGKQSSLSEEYKDQEIVCMPVLSLED